jgi:hypothetical protein
LLIIKKSPHFEGFFVLKRGDLDAEVEELHKPKERKDELKRNSLGAGREAGVDAANVRTISGRGV